MSTGSRLVRLNRDLVSPVTTVELVLRIARSYRWVREHGSNRGEAVAHFLQTVGLREGYPWCAAFVETVGVDAFGDAWPLPRTASVSQLADYAAAHGMLMQVPVPGAVFLLWSPALGRFHHTGFVAEAAEGSGWYTVEGNTNDDGSAEGIGVFGREREFGPKDRFIWWWRP